MLLVEQHIWLALLLLLRSQVLLYNSQQESNLGTYTDRILKITFIEVSIITVLYFVYFGSACSSALSIPQLLTQSKNFWVIFHQHKFIQEYKHIIKHKTFLLFMAELCIYNKVCCAMYCKISFLCCLPIFFCKSLKNDLHLCSKQLHY